MALQRRTVLSVSTLLLLLTVTLMMIASQQKLVLLLRHRAGAVAEAEAEAAAEVEAQATGQGLVRGTRPPPCANDSARAPEPSASPPAGAVVRSPSTASTVDARPSSPTRRTAANGSTVAALFKGEPVAGEEHIFFVETSCALNDTPTPAAYDSASGVRLSARAACALEAAAAAHPAHYVYLVHTCPVDVEATWRGAAPDYALAALSQPNVFLWPVDAAQLLRSTALEGLLSGGAGRYGHWPVAYASDVLRYFLLWKYGGTYFDSDVFVLKPLSKERDFACAESPEEVSASALDFSWRAPGRRMAVESLNETLSFRPDETSHSGDIILTRVLTRVCGRDEVPEMTPERCRGFHILPTRAVYPVPSLDWYRIFSEENAEDTMRAINESHAIHMWNHLSADAKVDPASQQPYAQIARRVCPNVVAVIDDAM